MPLVARTGSCRRLLQTAKLSETLCLETWWTVAGVAVPEDRSSLNAAERLATAVVEGAGGEDKLASYLNAAAAAATQIIIRRHRRTPETEELRIQEEVFGPVRVNDRPEEPNRYGPFSKRVAYSGWQRSLHPLNWFDTTPERTLANLADDDPNVELWARIQRGELKIQSSEGQYSPPTSTCATRATTCSSK